MYLLFKLLDEKIENFVIKSPNSIIINIDIPFFFYNQSYNKLFILFLNSRLDTKKVGYKNLFAIGMYEI